MLTGFLLIVLPVAAVLSLLLYQPWRLYIHRRLGRQGLLYHLPRYILAGWGVCLVWLTLLWYVPAGGGSERYICNLVPFAWLWEPYEMGVKAMLGQLAVNVLMFLPLGLLVPVVWPKATRRGTVLAALAVTAAVETAQFFLGRSADVDDLIMNTLGGLLGRLLYEALRRRFGATGWWGKLSPNR